MNLVEIHNAAFSYETELFCDINLTLKQGMVCCLMGPNGCGKSTLLDCVLGESRLSRGKILICGKAQKDYTSHMLARMLAYVPQGHVSTFPYTVEQVVLMGRTAHQSGMENPGREDECLVIQALERVGMRHLAQRPYTRLSGGELQMVMLARALVQDTPVILMDEPTAHLDFRNELLFLEMVAYLVRTLGVGVLMATHSPNQAFYLERQGIPVTVAAMGGGTMCGYGPPFQALTETTVAQIYHIDARLLEWSDGDGVLRQLVPRGTLDSLGEMK